MNQVAITRHAARQAQQRGGTPALLRTIWEYADIELPVGRGRVALRLSDQGLFQLATDQGSGRMERAKAVVLILMNDVVVMVLHTHGLPSRAYRMRSS